MYQWRRILYDFVPLQILTEWSMIWSLWMCSASGTVCDYFLFIMPQCTAFIVFSLFESLGMTFVYFTERMPLEMWCDCIQWLDAMHCKQHEYYEYSHFHHLLTVKRRRCAHGACDHERAPNSFLSANHLVVSMRADGSRSDNECSRIYSFRRFRIVHEYLWALWVHDHIPDGSWPQKKLKRVLRDVHSSENSEKTKTSKQVFSLHLLTKCSMF